MGDQREEHMRTALILAGVADSLEYALKGQARFEVREEAYDRLAQARRRIAAVDGILWPKEPAGWRPTPMGPQEMHPGRDGLVSDIRATLRPVARRSPPTNPERDSHDT